MIVDYLLLEDGYYLLQENDGKIVLENLMADKEFLYKIYDSAGNYVTTWKDVVSDFSVKSTVNAGISNLVVKLARTENSFGEGFDIKQGNILKVYTFDKDSGQNGICVFTGILTRYSPIVVGAEEYLTVEFFTAFWDLANKLFEVAGKTEIAYLSKDPSYILKDIIDKYSAITGTFLRYGSGTIKDTGTTVSYTFNTVTYQDAIKKVIELCPEGWYYRIDANNIIHLDSKEITNSHYFTMGKDIIEYNPEKRFENIVNTIYFTGGDTGGGVKLYKKFVNTTSITDNGIRAVSIVDERVTLSATAQVIADRILNEKASPEIRIVIKILDNNFYSDKEVGYDIESIEVGQTCKLLNATSKAENLWDTVLFDIASWDFDISNASAIQLQIMSIDYTPDFAVLELSNRQPDIAKRVEDINRNLVNAQTADNPDTPA